MNQRTIFFIIRSSINIGSVAMISILLGSCATVQRLRFQQPTASLEGVEITGIGLKGGSLRLLLDVYNPNSYDIHTVRVDAGLDIEDVHFGDARIDERITLAQSSTTRVPVPVRFTWEGVGAGARGLLGHGSVRYVLDSTIYVDTPLGDRRIMIQTSGEVPLRDLVR